jgi:hypothetical protein
MWTIGRGNRELRTPRHAFVPEGRELDTFAVGWNAVEKSPVEKRSFAAEDDDRTAAAAIEDMRQSLQRAKGHVRQARSVLTSRAEAPPKPAAPPADPPRGMAKPNRPAP